MSDVKISALPSASSAAGTDILPADQSGTTRGVTVAQLFTTPVQQSYEDFTPISDPGGNTGVLRIYASQRAGRVLPKWVGPSGLDTQFQAALDGNSVTLWLPGTGATAAINFATSWTVGATQATPTIAATNIMTSIKRATYTTTTTSGSAAGIRSAAPVAVVSTTTGMGGYFFTARWGVLTYNSAMQCYVGLTATSGAIAGDPSAQNNSVMMSKDQADTNWQFMTRNASTAQKTDSGVAVAAGGATGVFDFAAFCAPGTTSPVTGRITDITTGTVSVNDVQHSTDVPVSGSVLYAQAQVRTQTAGTAVAIFLCKIYVECDN